MHVVAAETSISLRRFSSAIQNINLRVKMIAFFYFCKWLMVFLLMAKLPSSLLPLFIGGLCLCHLEYFFLGGKDFKTILKLLRDGSRKVETYLLLLVVSVSMILFIRSCLESLTKKEETHAECWQRCAHIACETLGCKHECPACKNYNAMVREASDVSMPFFTASEGKCCGRRRKPKITKFEDIKATDEKKSEGPVINIRIPESSDVPVFKVPVDAFSGHEDADDLFVDTMDFESTEIAKAIEEKNQKEDGKEMKKSEESCKQKEKSKKK